MDSEVSSRRTAKRRRRWTVCAACAVLNGLLAASSLVLFAVTGPSDGEPRVLTILPPVLLVTFMTLLVACYVMCLDVSQGQDEGQDDEDGPGDSRNGDDDPSSGGGLDVDWERFEAKFRAYAQAVACLPSSATRLLTGEVPPDADLRPFSHRERNLRNR